MFLAHTDENFGSECSNAEAEVKPKAIPRKEVPPKPVPSPTVHTPAPQNVWILKFRGCSLRIT